MSSVFDYQPKRKKMEFSIEEVKKLDEQKHLVDIGVNTDISPFIDCLIAKPKVIERKYNLRIRK